jgi:hypothetical protein
MQRKQLVNRRTFLRLLVGLSLIVILVTGLGYRYRQVLLRRYSQLRLDESSGSGTLSKDEFEVIRAVCEVISPKPSPPTEELREFVNLRTANAKGCYREYQDAAALLESLARRQFDRGFAVLEEQSKQEILRKVLLQRSSLTLTQETEELSFTQRIELAFQVFFFHAETRFQELVFLDLLRFYWTSSAGWAAVGYQSYPGVPKPPRAYTLAPVHESLSSRHES